MGFRQEVQGSSGSESIDAVFTWVDGADPEHQAKRRHYQAQSMLKGTLPGANESTRFRDAGELYYSARLLRKHCPWVRNIFIVSDEQCPAWLDDRRSADLGITLVDHKEIFEGYAACLPTFNSQSIEAMLDRIPGLSDRFIYLNDDSFVTQSAAISDYFLGDKPIFRGRWVSNVRGLGRVLTLFRCIQRINIDLEGLVGRRAEAELIGGLCYFRLAHTPHPVNKQDLSRYLDAFGRENIVNFRFRNESQIWPLGLYANRSLRERCGHNVKPDLVYVAATPDEGLSESDRLILESGTARHLCVQSLDRKSQRVRKEILSLLEDMLAST